MNQPIAPPRIGGGGDQASGYPVKTLNAEPYCESTIRSPSTSPPTHNEEPIGGHLSATAKSWPEPLFPITTSTPAKQTTSSLPLSRSEDLKPAFSQEKDGRIVCVVYLMVVFPAVRLLLTAAAAPATTAVAATAPRTPPNEPLGGTVDPAAPRAAKRAIAPAPA